MQQANDQILFYKAVGVIIAIKLCDLFNRRLDIFHDPEKVQVLSRDKPLIQHPAADKTFPMLPVIPIREIHQENRHNLTLAGLRQGEGFDGLVMRPVPSREKNDGIRLLNKEQLARKEKVKGH